MSYQRHCHRNEIWFISKGRCEVIHSKNDPDIKSKTSLKKFDHFKVVKGEWHQIINPFEEDCHVIEIQYGNSVVEEDIERLNYYDDKNSL